MWWIKEYDYVIPLHMIEQLFDITWWLDLIAHRINPKLEGIIDFEM